MISHRARPTTLPLPSLAVSDVLRAEADLRGIAAGSDDTELIARRVIQYLYDRVVDEQGLPALALARFYMTRRLDQLSPAVQRFALGVTHEALEPDTVCLTLLASRGQRPEWNDAGLSRSHRAIPLPSAEVVARLPMVAQLLAQLGLEPALLVRPDPRVVPDLARRTYNVFHVEEAAGSPYIPAQNDFVVPYGIRSAVGFGSVLRGGELFAVVLFSRLSVSREAAELFRTLALAVRRALQPIELDTV